MYKEMYKKPWWNDKLIEFQNIKCDAESKWQKCN